ncbi:MAG: YdcF family protein [Actinomycetia bacterium]|nr:YdcF family protein [Actinomycetes bacterium]
MEETLPDKKADCCVILSLGNERLRHGALLYNQKIARNLMIIPGNYTGAEEMKILGIEMKVIDIFGSIKKYLISLGVPEKNILLGDKIVESTFLEAGEVKKMCLDNDLKSVLILTSAFHTGRSARIFRKIFSDTDIEVYVTGVPLENEGMSLKKWYTREKELLWVFQESIKSLLYFMKY